MASRVLKTSAEQTTPQILVRGKRLGEKAVYLGKKIWWLIVAASVAAAFVALNPHVSLSADQSFDQAQPFKAVFSVGNPSQLALYSLSVVCKINSAKTAQGGGLVNNTAIYAPIPKLDPGQSNERRFCWPVGSPPDFFVTADLDLFVTYRPQFWFWRKQQRFHFTSVRASSGHLIWVQSPG